MSLLSLATDLQGALPELPELNTVEWLDAPQASLLPILALPVANLAKHDALSLLCRRLIAGLKTRVAFLNAHCANVAARDATYRDALTSADLLLPDGSGLAVAARISGSRLKSNLNGTDLVPALCEKLEGTGSSVYLLGGKPGVADRAAAALASRFPRLRIAGTRHGYIEQDETDSVIDAVNASGADVLLVAMGVPLQDVWLHDNASALAPVLTLGVGGLFDFLSGRIPRAPSALRRTGFEWVYRLYQEPARMWRRYILGNPEFIGRVAGDAVQASYDPVRWWLDRRLKRGLDVACAAVGLAALAPLMLIVALMIRLSTPGPALFRQSRIGKNGKAFPMLKFRTMYIDAEARRIALMTDNQHGAAGVTFKIKQDPRITRVGRLLRKASIDEMPQLWNVLRGEMSLVGPRPQLPQEVSRYTPAQHRRLDVRPGLTCLWQISGRANLPFEKQVELDLRYLDTRNVFVDMAILARTVPAVLTARGAY